MEYDSGVDGLMNFYSIQFVTFLAIVLLCYYTVFRKQQWVCLLAASMVFYCFTGVENFLFLLLTGFTTWIGAKKLVVYSQKMSALRSDKTIEKEEKKTRKEKIIKKRRTIMWGVLLVNFGVLACLKYMEPILVNIGLSGDGNVLGIVLPLGISFYTFQSVGYLLDTYNEKYDAEENFAKYMLFVSYFPQMIQGPINRHDAMRAQFNEQYIWNGERATKAAYRIFYGLMKKYAIANILAVAIANTFDSPAKDYAGVTVVFAILLYSAQQYADFSGGIDMVLGVSELFGIHMAENFKQPYFSTSLADFWRRWHISLGKWMRDYVFYPFALTKPMKNFGKWANKRLGKHLGRVLPAAIGNLVVFFIVGIWHGAEWHYIVWGLYNGVVIAVSDILAPVYDKVSEILHINRKATWYHIFQIIRTFIVVNIGWYFDRITDMEVAWHSLQKTFFNFNAGMIATEVGTIFEGVKANAEWMALIGCVIVFVVSVLEENKIDVKEVLYRAPLLVRWGIYIFVIILILFSCTRVGVTGGFMYANF